MKKPKTAVDLPEWILNQIPEFDQEILRELKPTKCWITVQPIKDPYQTTLEAVRQLAEGPAYKPTNISR